MLRKNPFIGPCLPTLRKEPPNHPAWLHEVKFDGYHIQLHMDGAHVALYSRSGNDFTERYPVIADAVAKLPTKAVILDAELTACKEDGTQDFGALPEGAMRISASGFSTCSRNSGRISARYPLSYGDGSSTS